MKKWFITVTTVLLSFSVLFGSIAYAAQRRVTIGENGEVRVSAVYSTDDLAAGYARVEALKAELENDPGPAYTLPAALSEKLCRSLAATEYTAVDPESIVLQCVARFDNGACLINYYDGDLPEKQLAARATDHTTFVQMHNSNLCFVFIEKAVRERVKLLVDDRLYSFKEAYESGLIDEAFLWNLCAYPMVNGCVTVSEPWESPSARIVGDLNGDQSVTIRDATILQKQLADNAAWEKLLYYTADFNEDGAVNINDVTAIQAVVAGVRE